jgi:hypothetical protein
MNRQTQKANDQLQVATEKAPRNGENALSLLLKHAKPAGRESQNVTKNDPSAVFARV